MTNPSQMLIKINERRNKIVFRLLITLLLFVVGGFIYFYQTIPKENLDRLIGKSNAAKDRVYRSTPPSINEKSKENIIQSMKVGLSTEDYISRLEEKYLESIEENRELKVEIRKLNHKVEKQKKIIDKILK